MKPEREDPVNFGLGVSDRRDDPGRLIASAAVPVLRPIRPIRYGFDRIDELDALVSPAVRGEPTDRLAVGDVHPYNVRRLVRGVRGPHEPPDAPPFVHAARLLQEWKEQGVLVREPRPAIFAYEQQVGDASYRGAVCLVRLAPADSAEVRPHERTVPTGAEDELTAQLGALETQLSLVLGFVPDRSGALSDFLDRDDAPWLTVRDGDGVVNRLWREQDPGVHVNLAGALRDELAVIADGHHRYAAALRHQAACAVHGPVTRERPYDYVMMMLRPAVGGAAPARTHRVLHSMGSEALRTLEAAVEASFAVVAHGPTSDVLDALDGEGPRFAVIRPGSARVVRLREDADRSAVEPALRGVDAALLETFLLQPVRAASAFDTASDSRSGARFSPNQVSAHAVTEAALAGEVPAAFVLRTADPGTALAVAETGSVLPPRSTKFRPKPIKGLLMASLRSF